MHLRLAVFSILVTAMAIVISLQTLQVFSQAQIHLASTPTFPPPDYSPTPVDKAYAPAVFDRVSTPMATLSPDATPTCEPTITPPPPADGAGGRSAPAGNTQQPCGPGPTVTPGPSPTHGPTATAVVP